MGSPASVIRTFNFAKRGNIGFSVGVQVLNATSVRYVQLKAATTIGDLGAKGIGIKIANATLYGESFGSARGEVELMTLESTKEYRIEIQHDPVSGIIAWYVNGVLKGVQTTAANIPSAAEALTNLLCSVDNGATAAEVIMFVSPIEFLMEV
jgi:actin-like ATPase involved in cell morphogenesis